MQNGSNGGSYAQIYGRYYGVFGGVGGNVTVMNSNLIGAGFTGVESA